MLAIYSFVHVTEPGYGERIALIHGRSGGAPYEGGDLVTGERVWLKIDEHYDQATDRYVRTAAPGWSWRKIGAAQAEALAGLPEGSLPRASAECWPDPWVDQRLRDPLFIGVSTVLWRHPEVVFYVVDWRDFVNEVSVRGRARPTRSRDDSDRSSQSRPFTEGGSGDVERFCSQLGRWLTGRWPSHYAERGLVHTVGDAILADLRAEYDRQLEHRRSRGRLPGAAGSGPGETPREPARSFEQMLGLLGWTRAILAECETEVAAARERLRSEIEPYLPGCVQQELDFGAAA